MLASSTSSNAHHPSWRIRLTQKTQMHVCTYVCVRTLWQHRTWVRTNDAHARTNDAHAASVWATERAHRCQSLPHIFWIFVVCWKTHTWSHEACVFFCICLIFNIFSKCCCVYMRCDTSKHLHRCSVQKNMCLVDWVLRACAWAFVSCVVAAKTFVFVHGCRHDT